MSTVEIAQKKDALPSQTRLMAEFMIETYKKKVERSLAQNQSKNDHKNGFVQQRLITWLQNKIKEKNRIISLLQEEVTATSHIVHAEEHYRKKLEKENKKLKAENDFLKIAHDEETSILTIAMQKYQNEKNRYCKELQEANLKIASLEFDMQDKKKCLARVSHDLLATKEKLQDETLLRNNRDQIIVSLSKEKDILLKARSEEIAIVKKLMRTQKTDKTGYNAIIRRQKEKIHYLELELANHENIISLLDKERQATAHARNEEKEALLYFLSKYRTEQKKQQEKILEMKKLAYQNGKTIGQLTQSL